MRDELLRRAIGLAQKARDLGEMPFGSLLAASNGDVLIEEWNTVLSGNDISAHPEFKLALWASRNLDSATAKTTTMYTSCQPCGMCTGAIERSGLGKVVYALATEQLNSLKPSGSTLTGFELDGPALFDEARVPIDGYYS
ncbi:nucleoside deaminase [Kribbella sp. NBC_01245]|uniref:nucleoside deaminase n=1 Tax=Kribbella sp. NBC_01245 TaxID=2903578 RepID=UPI002E29A5DB|nr:nucleoside deaminase [Kribbella sp. NBC_01245]